jgi:phosphoenolpyruvate-protein phosphotransferase
MSERALPGVPAAPGVAVGTVRVLDRGRSTDAEQGVVGDAERPGAAARAVRALAVAAAEVEALAARLRGEGRGDDADIVETGSLIAEDPALRAAVEGAVLTRGCSPSAAICDAIEAAAAQLDSLDDATLAARAEDVRSLGRRAARIAAGPPDPVAVAPTADELVLVAADLGPADVAELGGEVRALVLAAGGVTGHAAIVARALGLPMVIGLGHAVLDLEDGELLVVDGGEGVAVASPSPQRVASARRAAVVRTHAQARAVGARALPTVTRDGRQVRVLANISGAGELAVAMDAGADGVGLLRTELAFLESTRWPTADEHRGVLEPLLARLAGRTATVRVLDFGGDKTPPFLRGARGRGIELLLESPNALMAQIEAILDAGSAADLRLLVPMVTEPAQLRAVRDLLGEALAHRPGVRPPLLGAMIEVPAAVAMADRLAAEVGLLSIGTNDLSSFQLGRDRSGPGGATAHHPAVLRLIADTVDAARRAGITVEVCGEAASDPSTMPLLLGLGVDELSVGAAMVGSVRAWVRALDHGEAQTVARRAIEAESAAEVQALTRSLRRLLEETED